jgi:hypothetical protein
MLCNEGCAASFLSRGSHQQDIFSFSFWKQMRSSPHYLTFESMDGQDASIYGRIKIVIVYSLYQEPG